MQDPKIEYLNSAYKDTKIETTKPLPNWLRNYLRVYFMVVGFFFPKYAANYAFKLFITPRIRAKHMRTDAVIDSAERMALEIEGNTIVTYRWGEFKKTILLVHGWESRGTALRMFVTPLNALGYAVLSFDAPAHGDSSGTTCTLPSNAMVIATLLRENKISGIIAHSFGCACSMFALQFDIPSYPALRLAFMAAPPRLHLIMEDFINSVPLNNRLKQLFFQKIFAMNANLSHFDIATSEPHVPVEKLLIIQDTTDNTTPIAVAKNVVNHWKKARLIITEGYGHYRLAKNPDVVKRIVNFLSDNE